MKNKILFASLAIMLIYGCGKNDLFENQVQINEQNVHLKGTIFDSIRMSQGIVSNPESISPIKRVPFCFEWAKTFVGVTNVDGVFYFYDYDGNIIKTSDFINFPLRGGVIPPKYKYIYDIKGIFTTKSFIGGIHRFYFFYNDRTFSIGDEVNTDRYQGCTNFNLPQGKKASDIVDVAWSFSLSLPEGPRYYVVIWFRDKTYTYTESKTSTLDMNFVNLYSYSLNSNKYMCGIEGDMRELPKSFDIKNFRFFYY